MISARILHCQKCLVIWVWDGHSHWTKTLLSLRVLMANVTRAFGSSLSNSLKLSGLIYHKRGWWLSDCPGVMGVWFSALEDILWVSLLTKFIYPNNNSITMLFFRCSCWSERNRIRNANTRRKRHCASSTSWWCLLLWWYQQLLRGWLKTLDSGVQFC